MTRVVADAEATTDRFAGLLRIGIARQISYKRGHKYLTVVVDHDSGVLLWARGLHGAEAVLKLRALHSNGDWDEYWRYGLSQEEQRIHQSLYAADVIPQAA